MTIEFPLDLKLNLLEGKRFYRYSSNEYTTINGKKHRSEISKIFHVTLKQIEKDQCQYLIETFDREHRDRDLSTSEKVFYERVAEITDEVKIVTDEYGEMVSVEDLTKLQDKTAAVTAKLSKTYLGRHAENSFRFLRAFYKKGELVGKGFSRNEQFGLIVNEFYTKYNKDQIIKRIIPLKSLMSNTEVEIEEHARLENFSIEDQVVILNYSGRLAEKNSFEGIYEELDRKKIEYDKNQDLPDLEQYEGTIKYNATGEIVAHDLNIMFTLGESYTKKLRFNLKEISYEEA